MANNEFARLSRKVAQYFWDPRPKSDNPSSIWCLGGSYDSRYQEFRQPKPLTGTSPSAQSDSSTSQADSAVVTGNNTLKAEEEDENASDPLEKSQADLTRSQEEALG